MKKTLSTQQCCSNQLSPEVYISVRKNRVKSHIDKIDSCCSPTVEDGRLYLQNGTEFQLEFHNNTTITQKAEIWINGKQQKDALVLRPGEHYYLDRFMDKSRKLKFDVYDVDDNPEVREIIENNGRIEVRFFNEYIAPSITWTTNTAGTNWHDYYDWYDKKWYNPCNITCMGSGSTFKSQSNIKNNFSYSRSAPIMMSAMNANTTWSETGANTKIETGRVAQGEQSNQNFVTVNNTFEFFPHKIVKYHILPLSQKPHEVSTKEFRDYCTSCGRRIKRGWVHCAGCGEKI